MFIRLRLQNFRKVVDDTMTFEPGLNVIRGLNEASKTTRLEAIAYACFGARALREPLSDTVTWGKKDSELKVELDFTVNGDTYTVKRSKAGAELCSLDKLVATGQDEVKRFIETLFGTSAETASRLMMASQKSLQGALEDGPGAAVKLIETLANFSLLDQIIGLAQTKLPNGATTSVSARISLLEAQLGDEPEDPTLPLAEAEKRAAALFRDAQATETQARKAWADMQPAATAADGILKDYETASQEQARAEMLVTVKRDELSKIMPVPGPSLVQLTKLRKAVEQAGNLDKARAAKKALDALPEVEAQWDGDRASLQKALDTSRKEVTAAAVKVQQLRIDQTRLEGRLIKETACAFCSKDLTDVPEVTQLNTSLARDIQIAKNHVASWQEALKKAQDDVELFSNVLAAGDKLDRVLSLHRDYVRVDNGFVPPNWDWVGVGLEEAEPVENAAGLLRDAEAKAAAYQRALGQKEQAEAALASAVADAAAHRAKVDAAEKGVRAAKSALDVAALLSQQLFDAEAAATDLKEAHRLAASDLREAKTLYEQTLAHRAAIAEQLAQAQKELKEMEKSNALIAKLRKARPQIADELWSIVTVSIGKYFSDVRGVASKVTREDNEFKVDGRSYKGLSGSTQDAFGLATRVALTRTFLPNADFLSLDEPAAACDPEREVNMLGMVASTGFKQVLLVTHSELCESFASKVIQL